MGAESLVTAKRAFRPNAINSGTLNSPVASVPSVRLSLWLSAASSPAPIQMILTPLAKTALASSA